MDARRPTIDTIDSAMAGARVERVEKRWAPQHADKPNE